MKTDSNNDFKAWLDVIQGASTNSSLDDIMAGLAKPECQQGPKDIDVSNSNTGNRNSLRHLLAATHHHYHHFHQSQSSLGDLSFVNIALDDDSETGNDGTTACSAIGKRVSWNPELEIREYNITEGEHPNCSGGFALTLDWDYQETIRQRVEEFRGDNEYSSRFYRPPKRLSLSERRRRLMGDVNGNLVNFALADACLDDILKDLEGTLNQITVSPVPEYFSFYARGYQKHSSNHIMSSRKRKEKPCLMIRWERVCW